MSGKAANVRVFWLILEHCPRYHIWRTTSRERNGLDISNFLSWIRVLSWTERCINIRDIAKPSGAGSTRKSGKKPQHVIFRQTVGFFQFTAPPFRNQTTYVNESCQFCSIRALVLETAESFGIHCLAVDIWLAEYGLRRYPALLISTIALHEKGMLCSS